ncbi:hypothetical protein AAFC00_003971 [Neodothiora populina]|uniref:Zinc/iron permease n=1 Tax=Neodothiora populina TaxID=2781224 RepID=A0ABR3PIG1_9PEZI
MGLSNDERGWIMTCISGVACVLGASIICADVIIQCFPGKRNFRIQDSDAFLSASLSLSFGVMLFSSLYSMLPSAKQSLTQGGFSPKEAAWILIACFLGGAMVIQLVSRVLHHYMPTHVVDCEHNHDDEEDVKEANEDGPEHEHHHHGEDHVPHDDAPQHHHHHHDAASVAAKSAFGPHRPHMASGSKSMSHATQREVGASQRSENGLLNPSMAVRRPSLHARLSQTLSNITTKKSSCDCDGPCYGFSEPCGMDCFKNVQSRGSFRLPGGRSLRRSSSRSMPKLRDAHSTESTPLLNNTRTESSSIATDGDLPPPLIPEEDEGDNSNSSTLVENSNGKGSTDKGKNHAEVDEEEADEDGHHHADHHHHVPTNAFLSIGLQTSIAIALHKLPEGFITYATNHANPTLGFSVFLALFIHNITEGFALALPLYLAINSRPKAMMWSFLLGGCSQPLGAGVAALWFKIAGKGDYAPGEGIYGGMFAVTAGIMASVALQLFSESLDLTHNRGLCMIFAFVGMAVLGVSSALTAS